MSLASCCKADLSSLILTHKMNSWSKQYLFFKGTSFFTQKELKQFAQAHLASSLQSWDVNPGQLDLSMHVISTWLYNLSLSLEVCNK